MALDGPEVSIVTLLKVPEPIKSHIVTSPWLISNPTAEYTPESVTGVDPEAGFRVETRDDLPPGEYVLHAVYLLSASPYQSSDATRAMELLYEPVTFETSKFRQIR